MFEHSLSPLKVKNVVFKNRYCVSPMGGSYGDQFGPHGEMTNEEIEYIIRRAKGGFGLFFSGCMFTDYKVDPCDKRTNILLNKADFKKRAARLVERAAYYDMKVIQQITLGVGRNGDVGTYSCSPTHLFGHPDAYAKELTVAQIHDKIDCLVEAAVLMKDCGFAGVEVHALHWGYLLDNFAMPLYNHRMDEYGGCLENRLRPCREIVEGIKAACGDDFIVSIRLGAQAYIKDEDHSDLTGNSEAGRSVEEAIEIARQLEAYGYDMLNVDVGVYESYYHALPPSYMPVSNALGHAAAIKRAVNIPVLCGSKMVDPEVTEKAIADGLIDGAVLGRASIADPDFVKKLECGRPDRIRPCIGCIVGCMGKARLGEYASCAVNPQARRELIYSCTPAAPKKNVAVIGGGVAGMEAARTLKLRGHDVCLYEKADRLGGLLHAAGAPAFKNAMLKLIDYYRTELDELGIPVKYGTAMDAKAVKALKPDAVVLALGSGSLMPGSIKGIDHPKAVSFIDAHESKAAFAGAKNIVVAGGGLVGCETALDFALDGKKVTIVEALPEILKAGTPTPIMIEQYMHDACTEYGIDIRTGFKLDEINDDGAVISALDGSAQESISADLVIIAIGRKRVSGFADELRGCGIEVYTSGDMNAVGNVYAAVNNSYEIARLI